MKAEQTGNLPDWNAIFSRRPDLDPPGYRQTVKEMQDLGRLKIKSPKT